jgi:hypothetical protein
MKDCAAYDQIEIIILESQIFHSHLVKYSFVGTVLLFGFPQRLLNDFPRYVYTVHFSSPVRQLRAEPPTSATNL